MLQVKWCLALFAVLSALPFGTVMPQSTARWSLNRDFVLGHDDPKIEHAFTKIKAVRVAPNGNVFVADARVREVRLFDDGGRHGKLVMREGRGPGDVINMGEMGMLADTLWTTDLNLRRITLLSQSGDVLRTVPYDPDAARTAGEPVSMTIAGILPNGEAIGLGETRKTMFESYERNIPHLLVRASRAGRALDTIAQVSLKNSMWIHRDGSSMIFTIQRFSDAPFVRVDANAGRAYVIDRTVATNVRTAAVTVTAIRPSGDTLWVRRLAYSPRRMERAAADSFRREVERSYSRTSLKAGEREKIAFIPNYRPPVSDAVVAADGTLWLRREEGQPEVEYWVLNGQGTLIGSVLVPRQVTLMEASGAHVWGVETDEDDVPRVVRFTIRR